MQDNDNWALKKEKTGGYYGIKIMMMLYNAGGRYLFMLMLIPVMAVYYLLSSRQRKYSKEYLEAVRKRRIELGLCDKKLSSFRHFLSFAFMMLEKIKAWQGKIELGKDAVYKNDSEDEITRHKDAGRLIICSHLGDIEALRAVFTHNKKAVINSVFFTDHAKNFNRLLHSISEGASLNIISAKSFGPGTAIMLREKTDRGEVVAIAADRVPVNLSSTRDNQVVEVDFLGRRALFPKGPFVLASILKCPVVLVFGLLNDKTGIIDIVCKDFSDKVVFDRRNREENLRACVQEYAKFLESLCLEYPYQWFNFFDFFVKE
ncbi:MAG: hypothetical protein ACI4UM_09095 [Succinivibrio sp.]